jgi:DNA-directed RNA polymerase sigma subunit (sigma70/sigma32)
VQTQGVRGNYEAFLMMPVPPEGATHSEIAIAMGCSRERVRQIEVAALRKLRHNALAMRLLREEDD